MPLGLEASDRKLLTICGTLLVLLLAATVALAPPGKLAQSEVPSTYSTQSAGAEAAYQLLSQMHYAVTRWEQPPNELPTDSAGSVLILANPTDYPSKQERAAINDFAKKWRPHHFHRPKLGRIFCVCGYFIRAARSEVDFVHCVCSDGNNSRRRTNHDCARRHVGRPQLKPARSLRRSYRCRGRCMEIRRRRN